ncbi:MAG TPA: NADP-dependent malic enzyme [Candidatus Polarisedimenticolia bacterium]|nr:NADP-dependent malic enzyme [Candidatus Polarisedimenticolia bacterium]
MELKADALQYHQSGRPGKIEVVPTKPCSTQRDLSLAYTPGVAEPCLEIARDPGLAFRYTTKGNLVAVVSNGTAVLGLGRIGALAGKPVMEGKGVLFKRFADIDVFDLEIDSTSSEEVIRTVKLLEPTFGGINLEDIAAPECFEIEEKLIASMSIPVFHDDQHGTAIISSAALLNALELQRKEPTAVRFVFSGAGAAGIACARMLVALGIRREQIILCDTTGVIYKGRDRNMNSYKEAFATHERCRTLEEALRGADVFLGVSGANLVSKAMVASMAPRPIILAMANPDPEIPYDEARSVRSDLIMATGRSDFPNQVNNVLGFPFIFRGALDVQARAINIEMKLAAVHALADLAKQSVPESVARAYGNSHFHFGPEYIIPKPFDARVLLWEASAVAKAAMDSGVARRPVDIAEYREALESRLGLAREAMRMVRHKARRDPRSIVFPEGTHPKILRAAAEIVEEKIARPILLGDPETIRSVAREEDVPLQGVTLVDPARSSRLPRYVDELYALRQHKGVTLEDARRMALDPNVHGSLMVRLGDADGLISGVTQHYPDTIRPVLQIVQRREGVRRVVGVFMLTFRNRSFFLADATVNVEPDAEGLAEAAVLTAEVARRFNVVPRVAMLSFSNFGSVRHRLVELVQEATDLVRRRAPELIVDGEMQADTAVAPEMALRHFPFSAIKGDANVLIFPDLTSGNITYKLLHRLGGAEVVGPILVGMRRPVHILHQSSEVPDIVNLTTLAVSDAQDLDRPGSETRTGMKEVAVAAGAATRG